MIEAMFFYDFFLILELGLQAHQFSFSSFISFFNLEKSVKCPQIWTSIMWVYLFMKVRRAELYDLIFPKHNGVKYFLKEHSCFSFIKLEGGATV